MNNNKVFIVLGILIFFLFVIVGTLSLFSVTNKTSTNQTTTTTNKAQEMTADRAKSEARAEVIKTQWTGYTNSIGANSAIVTAVVRNTGKTNVKLKQASGTVYDTGGKVVGNGLVSIYSPILLPNEEAYVAVQIRDTVNKENIKDAKVQITFDETNQDPIKLIALNDSGKKTLYDYEVVGELENPNSEEVKNVRALVVFFDKDGNFINTESAYPVPNTIAPHAKVTFNVSTIHLADITVNYKVIGFPIPY